MGMQNLAKTQKEGVSSKRKPEMAGYSLHSLPESALEKYLHSHSKTSASSPSNKRIIEFHLCSLRQHKPGSQPPAELHC